MHNLPRALGLLLPTGLELFRPAEPSSRSRQAGRPSRAAVQETKGEGRAGPSHRALYPGNCFCPTSNGKGKTKILAVFYNNYEVFKLLFPYAS